MCVEPIRMPIVYWRKHIAIQSNFLAVYADQRGRVCDGLKFSEPEQQAIQAVLNTNLSMLTCAPLHLAWGARYPKLAPYIDTSIAHPIYSPDYWQHVYLALPKALHISTPDSPIVEIYARLVCRLLRSEYRMISHSARSLLWPDMRDLQLSDQSVRDGLAATMIQIRVLEAQFPKAPYWFLLALSRGILMSPNQECVVCFDSFVLTPDRQVGENRLIPVACPNCAPTEKYICVACLVQDVNRMKFSEKPCVCPTCQISYPAVQTGKKEKQNVVSLILKAEQYVWQELSHEWQRSTPSSGV